MKKFTLTVTALLAIGIAQLTLGQTAATLAKINPAAGTQGKVVPVTLTGTNFNAGMPVVVNSSAGVDLVAVQIVSNTTVTAVLVVDVTAPAGARSVYAIRSGVVSNPVKFTVMPIVPTPAPLPLPTPAPIPAPTPLPPPIGPLTVTLDDFELGNLAINPASVYPERDKWSQYPNWGAYSISTDTAKGGTKSLKVSVTSRNAYIQLYPYSIADGGWGLAKLFLTSGAWTNNTFNRMRLWVKVPANFASPPVQYHNLELGTYVRPSSFGNYSISAAAGGSGQGDHLYHFFNIPATTEWYQIILDSHPSHRVSQPGAVEYGDRPYPTNEPNWNYFDALTRFYLDFDIAAGYPLASYPGNFYFDSVELYRESGPANVQQVYSLGGNYTPATNRVLVRWQHPKDDGVTCHEVRYAFTSVYTLGWNAATPAPSGTVCPADSAHAGMEYATTGIPVTGQTMLYVAIRPVGAATFNQISIPLGARP